MCHCGSETIAAGVACDRSAFAREVVVGVCGWLERRRRPGAGSEGQNGRHEGDDEAACCSVCHVVGPFLWAAGGPVAAVLVAVIDYDGSKAAENR